MSTDQPAGFKLSDLLSVLDKDQLFKLFETIKNEYLPPINKFKELQTEKKVNAQSIYQLILDHLNLLLITWMMIFSILSIVLPQVIQFFLTFTTHSFVNEWIRICGVFTFPITLLFILFYKSQNAEIQRDLAITMAVVNFVIALVLLIYLKVGMSLIVGLLSAGFGVLFLKKANIF
ncbi:hypothetical protein NAEGRDRAFT_80565 [Naegleria gruberi]|uniref:Uncharacterized protein n=1 Tax=Naegleria gruberi TaxID=5762 RepID=D2VMP1_NAEGR|nr:uncharacterized protein NAEGRDRAFT_80565 [Naegleria gruberi]EFC41769.1 hypothetical protein NAEGRDRAFT_80565 [Naegleria gruberi]|eukprot:XP_002674513.1 hypothetical protein NAEGRDRAFT_80565 [Naegleria gruberi strain NEG-M]